MRKNIISIPSQPTERNLNRPGQLSQQIFEIVGNPAYCDQLIDCVRMKWSHEFTVGQIEKLTYLLDYYKEYMVEFQPSFQQGMATNVTSVLKLLVHPSIIPQCKKYVKTA